jgi:hypothetical protein
MLVTAISAWLLALFFWGAACCKMTKLDAYLRAPNPEARRQAASQPGFWLPEYILLLLALPCGISLSTALVSTLRLSGHL